MKKTLFALAALAALATACVKEQQPSDAPAGQGDVTVLKVSVAPTKVMIDEETGACTWQEGDQLAVWYVSDEDATTGKKVIFTYNGLLEDGSAKFTANDEVKGYTAKKAAHPVNSVKEAGKLELVREWTYDAERRPMYLITEDITTNQDGSLSAQLSHSASVFKFTLHDIPAYAAGFVLETKRYNDDNTFKDQVDIITHFPYKTGYTADPTDDSNDVVLYSVATKNSYLSRIYLIDGDKTEIEGSEKKFKQSGNDVSNDDFIELPPVDFKKANLRKDYVKVGGVKWAKGNLQCANTFNTDGATGFQKGWRLAPDQWHHFDYENNGTSASARTYLNDGNRFEHFNYGGIARQARFWTGEGYEVDGVKMYNYVVPSSAKFDIAGKMYSDYTATTEVSGDARFEEINTFAETNHNKLWGDLAFWASKGKYRMPMATEMKKIHNEAHKFYGTYTTSDGKVIYGLLLTSVYKGDDREMGKTGCQFTDADLESGLFLPKAGRRNALSTSNYIKNVTTEACYRGSTYVGQINDFKAATYYYITGDAAKSYDNGLAGGVAITLNFGISAGYLIRPVLVEE